MKKHQRSRIGWQGIEGEVPEDWSLASISGDEKSGYFRVDSTESLTLEVRWSKASRPVNLTDRVESYLQTLKNKTRKSKRGFECRTEAKDGGEVSFSWESDRKAHGRIWQCEECGRVIIAQLSGDHGSKLADVSSWVLPSLVDHSDGGWQTWAMYGLVAEVPPKYRLEKNKLLSGYIQLVFRKGGSQIVLEQWGLAASVLKKTSLQQWFGDLVTVLSDAAKLRRPAMRLNGVAWVCEQSNKIYSIQSIHTPSEKVLDGMLDRLVCH